MVKQYLLFQRFSLASAHPENRQPQPMFVALTITAARAQLLNIYKAYEHTNTTPYLVLSVYHLEPDYNHV